MPTIDLLEWQQATPESHPQLRNLELELGQQERATLAHLDQQPMITVQELRTGVAISTTSYVGSIRAGPLAVRIAPKLNGSPFSALLGYAVGLPVSLLPEHDVTLTAPAFQDLIAACLASESWRLLAGGIYRTYLTRQHPLHSPRGRVLFSHFARGPMTTASLPCRFDERHENVLPNRVLLAGLDLAARLAVDPDIKARAQRLKSTLADRVELVALTQDTFRALKAGSSRLTSAYEPAFRLVRLLVAGSGIALGEGAERTKLPGFLLDMNRLFQDVLERFLREWLEGTTVLPQYRLQDVFRYEPGFNPRRQPTPTPRPDFVLWRGGRVVAIADAKYRDLWDRSLPSNMLYQLSVYALSQADCRTAVILYATTATWASRSQTRFEGAPGRRSCYVQCACQSLRISLLESLVTSVDDRPPMRLARLHVSSRPSKGIAHR